MRSRIVIENHFLEIPESSIIRREPNRNLCNAEAIHPNSSFEPNAAFDKRRNQRHSSSENYYWKANVTLSNIIHYGNSCFPS
jgi:hypothetical protein